MRKTERIVTATDGTSLFVRQYAPSLGDASRTLVIIHGASEHGGRYEHVAEQFVERNWNVVAADLRGHGQSGGRRTHVAHFHRYVTDVASILDGLELPAEQTALLGHSMGGLVSIRFAQHFSDRVTCLVATSPLLGLSVEISRATLVVGKMLSVIAPRWRFRTRVNPEDTTRSQEFLQQRFNDPLIHRSVTAGWFYQMKRALRSAWRDAHKLTLPLLVMQAGQDRIVDPDVVEPWMLTSGSADFTYHCLPDCLHELLNEPDWRATAASIADWLHERIGCVSTRANDGSAA
ncbi:MAG: alpha/beta hydrolase [Planctomycetaceae bacterium]|jgi:alpha-beta hydrolase superfamily lysophospholipase|nr:alpha/beta hydrolase [Planctomycetaceae bacterium]MBT6155062.1 alpha/beta hydrolase [Planctomycetaceae bacterium]MBT6486123.1 alpha/beta hydrolase [Planctomycetaceae bacterium]MBT6495246.1 alpha/beta hydrolase [Planctomycetaceae bacterium]